MHERVIHLCVRPYLYQLVYAKSLAKNERWSVWFTCMSTYSESIFWVGAKIFHRILLRQVENYFHRQSGFTYVPFKPWELKPLCD